MVLNVQLSVEFQFKIIKKNGLKFYLWIEINSLWIAFISASSKLRWDVLDCWEFLRIPFRHKFPRDVNSWEASVSVVSNEIRTDLFGLELVVVVENVGKVVECFKVSSETSSKN